MSVTARRSLDAPIVRPDMDGRMGRNINGPSLIAAPPWLARPLACYYLYFADHRGSYIRLALAERIEGPWRMHEAGCLELADSLFCAERPTPPGPPPAGTAPGEDWLYPHIASPDVHVEPAEQRVRMYFHGLMADGSQTTRLALSEDGLRFEVRPEVLGPAYFRVFRHGRRHYAHADRNRLFRSADGLGGFEAGPTIFDPATRHAALLVRGDRLHVFWTRIGDAPERILHARRGAERRVGRLAANRGPGAIAPGAFVGGGGACPSPVDARRQRRAGEPAPRSLRLRGGRPNLAALRRRRRGRHRSRRAGGTVVDGEKLPRLRFARSPGEQLQT